MKKVKIPCWIEAHRRMKWRMAMRIASLPEERWTSKIVEWNLGLDNKIRTNKSVGKPRKRWEDDINEFLRPEETEGAKRNDLRNNYTWKMHAKKHNEWGKNNFTKVRQCFSGNDEQNLAWSFFRSNPFLAVFQVSFR